MVLKSLRGGLGRVRRFLRSGMIILSGRFVLDFVGVYSFELGDFVIDGVCGYYFFVGLDCCCGV